MASVAIAAGGSLLGGVLGGKGAKKAAQAQAAAAQQATAEQHREYDTTRSDYQPYRDAGTTALGSLTDLLGLGNSNAQQGAISNLQASPLYQSLYRNGLDTVLNNASATGGLRGGNAQHSLYDLGTDTLGSVIQNQTGNLQNLVGSGLGAVGGTTSAGLSTSGNISNLLTQQGNANATAAAAPYAGLASGLTGATSALGNYFQSQQINQRLMSLFGGGSGSLNFGNVGSVIGSQLGSVPF